MPPGVPLVHWDGLSQLHYPVIQRNLENWFTPPRHYQPEIAQGRLEALLNFRL